MGGVFCIFFILITPSLADNHHNSPIASPPPFIQPNLNPNANANASYSPFKPSIAIVVAVLTTMFSITFLLLLYAKHCKRENGDVNRPPPLTDPYPYPLSTATRKNSGIDRTVIESLPIFRFGALRGHKDGLECAVCLAKFEPMEVLRLLPKCKHAFHVECVDTWLDGHSTCPLCRYRVDPEDFLLVEDHMISIANASGSPTTDHSEPPPPPEFRRVSGRHSSAGEFSFSSRSRYPASFRRSLDGVGSFKKKSDGQGGDESVAVGCFDRPRKDRSLLTDGLMADRKSFEKRFEHRIVISAAGAGGLHHQRWSDVQPSDLLYIRSEMLIGDSRRFSSGSSRPSVKSQHQKPMQSGAGIDDGGGGNGNGNGNGSGSGVINSRSVSEITGMSRLSDTGESNRNRNNHRQRHAGLVSRWLAWISSRSRSPPAVRSDRAIEIINVV